MALGPIEVVMIAFPENNFTGEIIPELTRLIEQDTISVVDALMVSKTADLGTWALNRSIRPSHRVIMI